MERVRRWRLALCMGAWLPMSLSALPLYAQINVDSGTVVTAATGEVSLPPDHARLTFGVVARATTAADAANVIGTTMSRIRDSLVAVGIPRDSVPTMGYRIHRRRAFETDSILGYDGETSVVVEIRDFAEISRVIEAVLGAGANDVSGIEFRARDQRSARDRAISLAMEEARLDAVALTAAAGRELGQLIELSTIDTSYGRPIGLENIVVRGARTISQTMAIDVVPQAITVRVRVTARWRLRE